MCIPILCIKIKSKELSFFLNVKMSKDCMQKKTRLSQTIKLTNISSKFLMIVYGLHLYFIKVKFCENLKTFFSIYTKLFLISNQFNLKSELEYIVNR